MDVGGARPTNLPSRPKVMAPKTIFRAVFSCGVDEGILSVLKKICLWIL